jgi:hypothetical protein
MSAPIMPLAPGPVVDHDRLAELLGELRRHRAREHVGRAARADTA